MEVRSGRCTTSGRFLRRGRATGRRSIWVQTGCGGFLRSSRLGFRLCRSCCSGLYRSLHGEFSSFMDLLIVDGLSRREGLGRQESCWLGSIRPGDKHTPWCSSRWTRLSARLRWKSGLPRWAGLLSFRPRGTARGRSLLCALVPLRSGMYVCPCTDYREGMLMNRVSLWFRTILLSSWTPSG